MLFKKRDFGQYGRNDMHFVQYDTIQPHDTFSKISLKCHVTHIYIQIRERNTCASKLARRGSASKDRITFLCIKVAR